MARIFRRHIVHTANASVLIAALALPTGLTISAENSQSVDGGRAGVADQTTDPSPPSPAPSNPTEDQTPPPSSPGDPTEDDTPPSSPTDPGTSRPTDPTDPTTSSPSTPSGTSETSDPSDPGDADGQTSDSPPEQEVEIDEVTTTLNEEKERVPEELVPTVEKLITIVSTAKNPETLPQDRQGVIDSAKNLSIALAAVSDPRTPPELRRELTAIVKQVTSALKTASDPRKPPEERSMLILVVKRTTSTLSMICDPETPRGIRHRMVTITKNTTYAVKRSQGSQAGSTDASQDLPEESKEPESAVANTLVPVSSSSDIMHDRKTPPKEREQLAKITQQVSALLKRISDPGTSQEERSEAAKELDKKSSRMKEQQERSASAQERPEESLGKAAAFCSSAIFESTSESALVRGLDKLVPSQWEDEGVEDFWKAKERSNETLDVLAQLGNNEHTHGPFKIVPLITELAELVPYDKLFGSLGASALACEQTATYLKEEFGVEVGSWLTNAGD